MLAAVADDDGAGIVGQPEPRQPAGRRLAVAQHAGGRLVSQQVFEGGPASDLAQRFAQHRLAVAHSRQVEAQIDELGRRRGFLDHEASRFGFPRLQVHDEGAAAHLAHHQAALGGLGIGPGDRADGDAQLEGEVAVGRKLLSRLQFAARDVARDCIANGRVERSLPGLDIRVPIHDASINGMVSML